MAISFVNKGAFASGTGALTVGAPASTQAGDLELLFVESANQAITTPSGWTEVTGSPQFTGTAAAAGGVRLAIFYRILTGASTSTSVADSGNHTAAIKMAFRGVDGTAPFDATSTTSVQASATTSATFPGITTVTNGAYVVQAVGLDVDGNSTARVSGYTNANLTGLTELHDQTTAAGVGGGFAICAGTADTAGATGNTTATKANSQVSVYITMALRPEPLATRTGDLAATETGSDTFASDGDVFVEGSLAVTETSSDTFSASGAVTDPLIQGTLATTETGNDTFTSTGDVIVQGSLAATETGSDTFTGTGDVIVQGSLGASETGNDTFVAIGGSSVAGTFAVTETGDDTFTASGGVFVTGSWASSEANDTIAGTGFVIITGDLTATEAGLDTFEALQGVLPREGSLAATEANDFFGLYAEPGYVDEGYFDIGVTGTLGRIGGMAAIESGGGTAFGINAVMKYYNGSEWVTLLKDPLIYT